MSTTLRLADEPGPDVLDWERKLHAKHRAELQGLILDKQSELKKTAAEIRQLEVDAILEGTRDDTAARNFSKMMTSAQSEYSKAVEAVHRRAERQWQHARELAARANQASGASDYLKDFDVARGLDANVAPWLQLLHQSHVVRYEERYRKRYIAGVVGIAEINLRSGEAGQSSAVDAWMQFETTFLAQSAVLRDEQNKQLREEIARSSSESTEAASHHNYESEPAAAPASGSGWRHSKSSRVSFQLPIPSLPSLSDTSHFPPSLIAETRIPPTAFDQPRDAGLAHPQHTRRFKTVKQNGHKRPRV